MRSLLESQVENIMQTEGSDRTAVYQELVEKLGAYSKDLRNLERANLVTDAQRVSEDLRIMQEQERKEIEARIAECAYYIETSKVSYQGLTDDLHQSEVASKAMEYVISSARVMIAKAPTLIQDHKLKLFNEKKGWRNLRPPGVECRKSSMTSLLTWRLFGHN